MMEFHISRQARDRYQFDQLLYSFSGNVIFANFHAVRIFVQKMNQKRDLLNYPEQAVKAGQVNAMGLIDEILHLVMSLYRRQIAPQNMAQALTWLETRLGEETLNQTLLTFTRNFPPLNVYLKTETEEEYLAGSNSEGVPNIQTTLEEMLLLWVANKNPAFAPYLELFDDDQLKKISAYRSVIDELYQFYETQPPFGPDQQNLIDMLRSPAVAVPHSLNGQLEYIRSRWADLLGSYLYRLLSSLDLLKEEEKMSFSGPGPIAIPTYAGMIDAENFSPDREWMPRLVMIAKNTYVWLSQLSEKYQSPISRLDQIPDEELDYLAHAGFTGLWLIGLWERSQASARIKQLCGNPEAISSAYSLYSYEIAAELGGEDAYRNLRERAWQRGIRLASDMVPNHMAIDSWWVVEHPEWFLSLDYCPFPSYTFNGPNLSPDGRAGIYIEDHYYDRTDAAVVFKRVDHQNGQTSYIYHGNDGTSMPWNDTAQLNYLNPQVREQVIQTILDVARRFPIIRFDAAMTLAKKHYQRLWFPEPGSGGDIATRAEHGMTRQQFDNLFTNEFWREVVERVAQETPDTLLLAEAFWMMESYFVRTLGMHRVYNSAFMNILRDEDNAKYRLITRNTLEFDPEILKRFVNFMNNPDERTAIDQFGDGDKYFGICTLMATLPGLPMFGHGQVEGFAEKYGMEFKRAYWDEKPRTDLVERHQRQIFPLLHRRAEFAGIEHFRLYDFFTPAGYVDENVFAYSNGLGSQRNLVIYHNKFAHTNGYVRMSVAFNAKDGKGLQQTDLASALGLSSQPGTFIIFRDQTSNLEYLHPSAEIVEKGLYIELGAYQCHAFVDFRQVVDDDSASYRHLYKYLGGRGVPNIQQALNELLLQPVLNPFRQIVNPGYFQYLLDARCTSTNATLVPQHLLDEAVLKYTAFLEGVQTMSGLHFDLPALQKRLYASLQILLSWPKIDQTHYPLPGGKAYQAALETLKTGLNAEQLDRWLVLLVFLFVRDLGNPAAEENNAEQGLSLFQEYRLAKVLADCFQAMGSTEKLALEMVNTLQLLIRQQDWLAERRLMSLHTSLQKWLSSEEVQRYLGVNRHQGILWYNKESFENFVWWLTANAVLAESSKTGFSANDFVELILALHADTRKLLAAENKSGYQIGPLLDAVEG